MGVRTSSVKQVKLKELDNAINEVANRRIHLDKKDVEKHLDYEQQAYKDRIEDITYNVLVEQADKLAVEYLEV